jgi:hypothetical protein
VTWVTFICYGRGNRFVHDNDDHHSTLLFLSLFFVERVIEIDENLSCSRMISRWRIAPDWVAIEERNKEEELKTKGKRKRIKITRDKPSVIRIRF